MEKQTLKHSKTAIATLGKLKKKFSENKCLRVLDNMIENESIDLPTAKNIHSLFKQMALMFDCIKFEHTSQNKHAKLVAKLIKDDLIQKAWAYKFETIIFSFICNYINAYYKEIIKTNPIEIYT